LIQEKHKNISGRIRSLTESKSTNKKVIPDVNYNNTKCKINFIDLKENKADESLLGNNKMSESFEMTRRMFLPT
jgi:hypothetical protein